MSCAPRITNLTERLHKSKVHRFLQENALTVAWISLGVNLVILIKVF